MRSVFGEQPDEEELVVRLGGSVNAWRDNNTRDFVAWLDKLDTIDGAREKWWQLAGAGQFSFDRNGFFGALQQAMLDSSAEAKKARDPLELVVNIYLHEYIRKTKGPDKRPELRLVRGVVEQVRDVISERLAAV